MAVAKTPAELLKDAISQIQNRRTAILKELREIDEALDRYKIDPRHVANANGRKLAQGGSDLLISPPSIDLTSGKVHSRKRRAAPSVEWLAGELREGKRSQSELTRRAVDAGYSDTAAVALLKKNARKFKSERAPRVPGARGNPAMIWALRGV